MTEGERDTADKPITLKFTTAVEHCGGWVQMRQAADGSATGKCPVCKKKVSS